MNLIYLINRNEAFALHFKKTCLFLICAVFLSACSVDPFIEDWNRDRLTTIEQEDLYVRICFDRTDHSRQQIEELARQECRVRIEEQGKIQQVLELQEAQNLTQAEGRAFRGPVNRQRDLNAQISTLQIQYDSNTKWDCPLLTPNRVIYYCQYNPNATDSLNRSNQNLPATPQADLPPELPEDLKP